MKLKQMTGRLNSVPVRKKAKRLLALTLAVLMVNPVTGYGVATHAQESETITAFAELSHEIATQQIAVGADESDIQLPDTLSVTLSVYGADTAESIAKDSHQDKTAVEESQPVESTPEEPEDDESPADDSSVSGNDVEEPQEDANSAEDNTATDSQATVVFDSGEVPLAASTTGSAISTDLGDADTEQTETEEITSEERTLTGITWQINAERSGSDTFDSESAGAVFFYEPVLQSGYTLADGVNLPQIQVNIEDSDKWIFSQSTTIDGIEITVKAEKDVLPEGAILHAKKVTSAEDKEKIQKAVNEEVQAVDTYKTVTELVSFDITITDSEGNELQPDTSNGEVKVSFAQLPMVKEDTAPTQELKVFHMDDDLNQAEGLDTTVDQAAGALVAPAEHFSVYSVMMVKAGAGTIYDISTGALTINSGNVSSYNNATIAGAVSSTTKQLTIDGVTVNLTIEDLSITITGYGGNISGINLKNGATLNLTVKGTNALTGDYGGAGINVPQGCTLNIKAESTGTLTATGGNGYGGGAGIGAVGNQWNINNSEIVTQSVGTIYIAGGTIIAKGGTTTSGWSNITGAAGIGGSTASKTGDISISGGTVTATGGYASAGIGGAHNGCVNSIRITGGTVTATSGDEGSAIGSGYNGNTSGTLSCGEIAITVGDVTANGNIGYGGAAYSSNNVGGTVSIESKAAVKINNGVISPAAAGVNNYPISVTIYDGRLTDTVDSASITIGGISYKSNIQVSEPYVGTLSCTLAVQGTLSGTQAVTVSGGGYSWADISCSNISGGYSGKIGEKLYPVFLWFYDPAITADIAGTTVSVNRGGTALNAESTAGIVQLACDGMIVKQGNGTGKMTAWMTAGAQTELSVTVGSLNSGNPMSKSGQTILAASSGTIIILRDIGETPQLAEQLDLSLGSITFAENGGKLNITYTPIGGESETTVKGQYYRNEYEIIQTNKDTATTNQIIFQNTTDFVKVKLNGVNMSSQGKAIDLQTAKVQLNLSGDSIIDCGGEKSKAPNVYYMGVHAAEGSELTIDGNGSLTITNPSNFGVGIGGYFNFESNIIEGAGTIRIEGGTITASTKNGTAIGSGYRYKGVNLGSIYITGGNVNVSSSLTGAAIGGGSYGVPASIYISGGTVEATSTGNLCGAAIGGGSECVAGGIVEISGGRVTATSTGRGAAIGGSDYGVTPSIHISGGTVTATNSGGTSYGEIAGAAIGGGARCAEGGSIEISGGVVIANAIKATAIGGGDGYTNMASICPTIIINGGTVTANKIGNGDRSNGGSLAITGGTIHTEDGGKPSINVTPTNGTSNVYYTKVDTSAIYGNSETITSAAITDYTYGFTDVKTDGSGILHLFLPTSAESTKTTADFNGVTYSGTITSTEPNTLKKNIALQVSKGTVTSTGATLSVMAGSGNTIYYVASDTALSEGSAVESAGGAQSVAASGGTDTITLSGLSEDTEYTYYLTAKEGTAYSDVVAVTFTTAKKSIAGATVTLTDCDSFTYDGTEKTPTVTVKLNDQTLDASQYDVSYSNSNGGIGNHTNAGTVTVTVTASSSGNYVGTVSQTEGVTYTIGKAPLTVTSAAAEGRKYNGTMQVSISAVILDGVVNSDDVSSYALETGTLSAADVGTYNFVTLPTMYLDGVAACNYTLTQPTVPVPTTVSITKADILNLTGNATMVRNQANYTVDLDLTQISGYPSFPGGTPFFTVTSGSSYNGLTSATVNASGKLTLIADNTANDTTDTVTVSITGMGNYANSTITVTINYTDKTPVTISGLTAHNRTYNGETHKGYTGTPSSSYIGAYEITYTGRNGTSYNSATAPVNAGDYTVTFKVPDNHATYAGSVSISFEIAKATITTTADNKSMTTGGTLPSFTVSYTGIAAGDTANSIFTTPATASTMADGKTAGSYVITVSNPVLTTDAANNYTIGTIVNGTLTVSTPSSSGSSSSGGSTGGSSTTTPTTTLEKMPNQPVTAVATVTATAGKNGAASASAPDKAVTDAIAKAQANAKAQGKIANGIAVQLDVTTPKGTTFFSVTLTRSTLDSLVNAGVENLEINGPIVKVSFDKKALSEIQKKSTGNISISIAPKTNLSYAAKKIIGTRPVYDITVGYGSGKRVSSFGGGVATVSIPYTLGKNEAVGGLYAVYVDANGNATRIAGSAYDTNSGCVIFTTTHFSQYGIGYTEPTAKFTDISYHWAKESIDYVVGRGLISGTSETAFSPDTTMTRGMLVTALGRLAGVDTKTYTGNIFTDVKADSAFRPYIEWAYRKNIVNGIGNQQFATDRAVTREEIAVIFANYAKATGYSLPITREATTYADASSIGIAYKDAVKTMQQAGIMMGSSDNKFNPKANATRAEVSSMLSRYIKLTIDPKTSQGWAKNDAGKYLYYKNGKALTGTQSINGVKYFLGTDGTLKTGWVKDGDNWRFYSVKRMLVSFWDIGVNGNSKTYYFTKDGLMVSGKWLEIDGKWYYFYADGSLARNTKIYGYEVDEKGVRKMK